MSGSNSLPPVPASLKQIAAYIQRAEELKTKDPVIAYWCTYYAAQVGLDLKVHEVAARDYLFALIASLEEMKASLKGNDAVENEAAGAAYVENFALRVFAMADNEDRRGDISRSTAKKFVAAANFLELLRVFEKDGNARVSDDKVKYAKWKAFDIGKAIREGRKPTPGGPGQELSGEEVQAMSPSLDTPFTRSLAELSPNGSSTPLPSDYAGRTPAARSRQLPEDAPQLSSVNANARTSPAWSGSTIVGESDTPKPSVLKAAAGIDSTGFGPNYAEIMAKKSVHFSPSVVGGMSSTDGSPPPSPEVAASTRPEYFQHARPGPGPSSLGRVDPVSAPLPDSSPSGSSDGSPSARARSLGRPRSGSSPPLPHSGRQGGSPPGADGSRRISPPSKRLSLQQPAPAPPPTMPPSSSSAPHHRRSSSASRSSPPQGAHFHLQPSPPGSRSPTAPGFANLASPRPGGAIAGLPPTAAGSYAATGPYKPSTKTPSPPTPGPPLPQMQVELTQAMIAKAQKHCRFAISSLEYEDAEQARKELRAALAILGDR